MNSDLTVLEAKRYGIYHCEQSAPLRVAAQLMADKDISALVVTDEQGYLAGIISRTDMLRALLTGPGWRDQTVKSYMNQDVVTVEPRTTLKEVARLLLQYTIHRVVVVREEQGKKRPLAVVSAADIVYHMVRGEKAD
jgi:CBS domain-containing protein